MVLVGFEWLEQSAAVVEQVWAVVVVVGLEALPRLLIGRNNQVVIQMAFLTGTDIVDHLRMLTLELGEANKLIINQEYQKVFDKSLEKMLENSKTFQQGEELTDD